MNDSRRTEILQLAQGELVRSHGRRKRRRAVAAAMTTCAVLITAAIAVIASSEKGARSREGSTHVAGDAPRTPETHESPAIPEAPTVAVGDESRSSEAPTLVASDSPIVKDPASPTALTADVLTARFEIDTIERPSAGFVEVIDDAALDRMLRSLPRSTGVAVIAGRTHIVANQEWKPAALIR